MKVVDALSDLAPLDAEKYENVDLDRLTAYGIKVLIDSKVPTTFENIVVALFRLFPTKFSLLGYPQFPDAARVNRALLHGQPKYRNYLAGGARRGYFLTVQGLGAAEETEKLLKAPIQSLEGRRRKPSLPRAVADQFMREVSDTESFRKFQAGAAGDVGEYDLLRILHAGPGTSLPDLARRLDQLVIYADQTKRKDVRQFLEWLRTRFISDAKAQQ